MYKKVFEFAACPLVLNQEIYWQRSKFYNVTSPLDQQYFLVIKLTMHLSLHFSVIYHVLYKFIL